MHRVGHASGERGRAVKKTRCCDGRCWIYQFGARGFAYNPSLREWELYEMDPDGSIQDLCDRVKTRREAEGWAKAEGGDR